MDAAGYDESADQFTMSLRPALPTDSPAIAYLAYLANRSHLTLAPYDLFLPGAFEQRLGVIEQLVRARTVTWFHWSHFVVAEEQQQVAAVLAGYDSRAVGLHCLGEALYEIGWGERQIAELNERVEPFEGCTPSEGEHAWSIDHVATLPTYRDRGLASALLNHMVEKARGLGFSTAQLNLYIGNFAAQRIYEKAGFQLVEKCTDPGFEAALGCPGIARMVLALT